MKDVRERLGAIPVHIVSPSLVLCSPGYKFSSKTFGEGEWKRMSCLFNKNDDPVRCIFYVFPATLGKFVMIGCFCFLFFYQSAVFVPLAPS